MFDDMEAHMPCVQCVQHDCRSGQDSERVECFRSQEGGAHRAAYTTEVGVRHRLCATLRRCLLRAHESICTSLTKAGKRQVVGAAKLWHVRHVNAVKSLAVQSRGPRCAPYLRRSLGSQELFKIRSCMQSLYSKFGDQIQLEE